MLTTLIYPRSRGTLRLASTDPTAAPLIDFNYLADQADLDVLTEGSEMVREIMAGAAFGGAVKSEIHPGAAAAGQRAAAGDPQPRDVGLPRRRHLPDGRRRARGRRPASCGSAGVEGLRVCDASVMPSITGGNTNAPAMVIGEIGAELMTR